MPAAPKHPDAEYSRVAEFVDTAALLFAQRGFDRTSVREIAQAMRLTSGTMFYHFKTKDDLLEAVIRKGMNDGVALMNDALRRAGAGPIHRLLALVSAHIKIVHGDLRHVHRVWIREWDHLNSDARLRLRAHAEHYRATLDALLLALVEGGHLRTDPVTARHLLLPALNWAPAWAELPDDSAGSAAGEQIGEQICAGLLNQSVEDFRKMLEMEAAGRLKSNSVD